MRVPEGYRDDSSGISYSALGLLLLLMGAAWSALGPAAAAAVPGSLCFPIPPSRGGDGLLSCVLALQNREITFWDIQQRS